MNILARSVIFSIPKEWIPRWELLLNFQSDNEGEEMPLDRDPKEVQLWIDLNNHMNEDTSNASCDMSLEAVRHIVDFMLPTSDAYLFYVHNDLKNLQKRAEVYTLMGLYATAPNRTALYTSSTNPNAKSIQFESTLHRLMKAHPSEEETQEVADKIERCIGAVRTKILKIPYMTLLGILIRSSQLGNWTIDITKVDWSILRDVLFNQESISAYEELGLEDEDEMAMKYYLRLQNLPDVSLMTNLRILAGVPLLTPINNTDYELHSLLSIANSISQDFFITEASLSMPVGLVTDMSNNKEDPLVTEPVFAVQHTVFFLNLVDKQVDINSPEYLPGIAKYILGLGPILDTGSVYSELRLDPDTSPLYTTVLRKMIEYTRRKNITARNVAYSGLCKVLAATIGTKYLHTCIKCIVRILEHHKQIGDNGEYIRRNPHIMFNTWETRQETPNQTVRRLKEQDKQLDSFARAAIEFLADDGSLTDFTAWPQ